MTITMFKNIDMPEIYTVGVLLGVGPVSLGLALYKVYTMNNTGDFTTKYNAGVTTYSKNALHSILWPVTVPLALASYLNNAK